MSRTSSRTFSDDRDVDTGVTSTLSLVTADQTYVCFDVEQPCDAKQELVVSRSPDLADSDLIAFRMRTNAPTRYIVNPNSGVLTKARPQQTMKIELVGNRFNPHHRLVVQAIKIDSEAELKQVWKSNRIQKELQVIPLELSTTLMSIDTTNNIDNIDDTVSITSILEQSSRTGDGRVKELEGVNAMLKDDIEKINNNTKSAFRLKDILLKQISQRKELLEDLKKKLKTREEEYTRLAKKLESQEVILKHLQTPKNGDNNNCVIS
ncbi:unnamed protein product [Bursaphelenchus okinawaensis]|uniref:Major sperm protein n=1 Tax=Bursaphelenchus okinawaensis TaxID=465554 RepID=A0A811K9F4_9BILA|nr:unnamed protein product [Bursaphelenchus okinawaensis]CAG9094904.1 unnamed protein product [Bursaphelenchus okinawaensis]